MGVRYRKTVKIAPGIKLNISKSGVSTSFGTKGATVNVSKRGIRTTAGLPGTGLSYSSYVPKRKARRVQKRALKMQRRQVMKQYHLTGFQMNHLEKKLKRHPEAFIGKSEEDIIRMVQPLRRPQGRKRSSGFYTVLIIAILLIVWIASNSK